MLELMTGKHVRMSGDVLSVLILCQSCGARAWMCSVPRINASKLAIGYLKWPNRSRGWEQIMRGFQEVCTSSGYSFCVCGCVCVSSCLFLTGLALSSVMRARVHAHSC